MTRPLRALPVLIALIIALPACAEVPSRVTAQLAPQPLEADNFILTLPVEPTSADSEILILFRGDDESRDWFEALRVTAGAVEFVEVRDGTPTVAHHRAVELPGGAFELTIHRREPHTVLSADGRMLAHLLHDESLELIQHVGAQATGATIGDLMVQPLGDVTFDEDFFATESVPNRWETLRGEWHVGIYWDPLQEMDDRPIGASWYEPGEGGCLTAAGYAIFDSYRLSATTRIPEGRGGLAFHVRGPDDYCAFEVGEGTARIVQVAGGEREVLAEAPLELRDDWYYRLRADVSTGHARCFVNDDPLVEADLSPALIGQIGLTAHDAIGSRFDDVTARPFVATRLPHGASAEQALMFDDGTWQIEDGALVGHVKGQEVAAVPGGYHDCEVSADVEATRNAVAGVVAGHSTRGHRTALLFTIKASDEPTWQLHHVDGDETAKLASGPAPAASGLMTLRIAGGRVTCMLDGEELCETFVSDHIGGRPGVYLQGGRATFRGLTVRQVTDEPQAIISHVDGTNAPAPALEQKKMVPPIPGLWRPQSGSWKAHNTDDGPRIVANAGGEGEQATIRFHEVTPGEPRLTVEAEHTTDAQVTLGICMGEEPGYEVEYSKYENSFRFLRRGEVLFESGQGSDETCQPGEVRRDGDRVVIGGRVWGDMETVYAWRDPDPLPDGYAEVTTTGGEVQFSSITLGSDSALAYTFDRVEPDWQPRTGEWSDHTGMACILWDYWMTGDGREEPAFTWNRHELPADVAVDISAAEFTEGHESGAHEHFPYHDISVILGGAPGDPDSGYRFIVGADEGARTVLLRDGVEVASNDDRRCRIVMGGHANTPRAVRIRAQRAGDTLTLIVNGFEAIAWTDPEPLSGGGHVGLGCDGCRVLLRDCVVYPGVRGGS